PPTRCRHQRQPHRRQPRRGRVPAPRAAAPRGVAPGRARGRAGGGQRIGAGTRRDAGARPRGPRMSAHLPLLPILVPLVAAALALMFEHRRIGMAPQRIVAWISMALMLLVAVLLVRGAGGGEVAVYLLGDWPARLGIALMV